MTNDYPQVTKGGEPLVLHSPATDAILLEQALTTGRVELPRRVRNLDPEREMEDLRSIADVLERVRRQERERIVAAIRKQAQAHPFHDMVIEVLGLVADALETGRL